MTFFLSKGLNPLSRILIVFLCSVPVPSVEVLDVYEQTSSSMRVKWDRVKAATGYILLFRPINEPQLEKEVDFQPADSSHQTRIK